MQAALSALHLLHNEHLQGEKMETALGSDFSVQPKCPAWRPTSWYHPSNGPTGTRLSPLPGHPSLLAVPKSFQLSTAFFMFASSSSFFPSERSDAEPVPKKVPVFFLERRRSQLQVSTPAPAALESPSRAGSDQPGALGRGCPCHPFPASSGPPALLRLTGIAARLRALAVRLISPREL